MAKKTQKNIKEILELVEKEIGKEAVMLLGKKSNINIEIISSGSYLIDNALIIGGYPKGRIIEIFGPESSGKTTLALHAINEVQKAGGIAAFIDVEHSIDPEYAKNLGINIDDLILSQPNSGEQALEIVDVLAKTGAIDLIVLDSVAALAPECELQGEMKDQTIGAQARLMSKALRKITGFLSKSKTTIIFINQVREKIGMMFGNPLVTPGGRALKFYSTIRMELRKISTLSSNEKPIGNLVRVRVVKNKLAPPFQTTETEIIFSQGISKHLEIIKIAEKTKILTKSGTWYLYGDKKLAYGKQKLWKLFQSDKTLFNEIQKKALAKIKDLGKNKIL